MSGYLQLDVRPEEVDSVIPPAASVLTTFNRYLPACPLFFSRHGDVAPNSLLGSHQPCVAHFSGQVAGAPG